MCHSVQTTQVVFRQGQQLGGLIAHMQGVVTQCLWLEVPLVGTSEMREIFCPSAHST